MPTITSVLVSLLLLGQLTTPSSAAPFSNVDSALQHVHPARNAHEGSRNPRRVLRPMEGRSDSRKVVRRACNANQSGTSAVDVDVTSTASSQLASPTVVSLAASQDLTLTSRSSLDALFPLGHASDATSWSTSDLFSSPRSFNDALPVSKGKLPTISTAPDGSTALEAFYPSGSINPGNKIAPKGGFSFYSGGPGKAALEGAKEVTFSYAWMPQANFGWQLGGKLIGLYGGSSEEAATSCSGGRQEGRDECFSVRMMWRENGMGEFYNYLPISATQPDNYCSYPPKSECNPDYGDSIGRGAFNFIAGEWTTVSQRIRLNDVGSSNGELELFVEGKSKISLKGLTLRVKPETKFRGIVAQTFFGGSSTPYASPSDQYSWFRDFSLAIIE